MFGLRKTLGSILLLVIFLALAALATFFYNADQAQKEEITKNELFQKGQETVETLLGASLATSETMADANLQKNIGIGKTMADMIGKVDWRALLMGPSSDSADKTLAETTTVNAESSGASTDSVDGGFWSNLGGKLKTEWVANQEPSDGLADSPKSEPNFINYQKTDKGAEIIITPKNGGEYKIGLPFKFLNRF